LLLYVVTLTRTAATSQAENGYFK